MAKHDRTSFIQFIALAMCLHACPSSTFAQDDCIAFGAAPACGSHELGVTVFSWINLDLDETDNSGNVSYFNGLLYKLHCGEHVLRLGADVFRYSYQEGQRASGDPTYPWFHNAEGHFTTFAARLGYERRLNNGKLQPFLGVDLNFRYVKQDGTIEGMGDFGPPYSYSMKTQSHSAQYMIAPLAGLQYRPIDRFSVSIETSYAIGVGTRMDDLSGEVEQQDLGFWNPVRAIYLSYHF